jgi:uncharacterized protein YkwD
MLLLGALAGSLSTAAAGPAAAGPGTAAVTQGAGLRATLDLDLYESRVLHVINQRRSDHGRRPVRRLDSCVDRLSERWAAHLAATGDFAHRDQRVVLNRCDMHWAGEDLARGTAMRPAGAVRAWMHSSEHRAVLLKRRADRAGIGVRLDDQGRVVLVLNLTDTRG